VDHLFVVTHPDPIVLEARPLEQGAAPAGSVALGYFHDGRILARGVVAREAVDAIHGLLEKPVSLALAASEDEDGNIDARVCLVLPIDVDEAVDGDADGDEPWKASVPAPPIGLGEDSGFDSPDQPKLALLPIGNVVRGADQRRHADVADDAREMLRNLLAGRARDAVQKAIDDLLDSL